MLSSCTSYGSTTLLARTGIHVCPTKDVRTEGLQKGVPTGKETAEEQSDQLLLSVAYFCQEYRKPLRQYHGTGILLFYAFENYSTVYSTICGNSFVHSTTRIVVGVIRFFPVES